jgi:hypothetical protein
MKFDNNFGYPKFTFDYGFHKVILDKVINTLKKEGFRKDEIVKIWSHDTGITFSDAKEILYDRTKSIQLWELTHLFRTFGFKLSVSYDGSKRYSYSVEDDRIIMHCHKHPTFTVNMNINDLYDFDINFIRDRARVPLTIEKAFKHFKDILYYYFFKEAEIPHRDGLPYNAKKMKAVFFNKFYNEEFSLGVSIAKEEKYNRAYLKKTLSNTIQEPEEEWLPNIYDDKDGILSYGDEKYYDDDEFGDEWEADKQNEEQQMLEREIANSQKQAVSSQRRDQPHVSYRKLRPAPEKCPKCGSEERIKHGRESDGRQCYKCKKCQNRYS